MAYKPKGHHILDLWFQCGCRRNYRFPQYIGSVKTVDEIMETLNDIIPGARALKLRSSELSGVPHHYGDQCGEVAPMLSLV
jgi:hypothetical protein